MIHCDMCWREFDPVAFRWRCPSCGYKASCCEGAPLPSQPVPTPPL